MTVICGRTDTIGDVAERGKVGRPPVGTKSDPLIYRSYGLLESQIEWLLQQPGGASAKLRELVEREMWLPSRRDRNR